MPFFPLRKGTPVKTIPLHVNGHLTPVTVDDPDVPLLYALRDGLGLQGPRFGCGLGQCGSCTVHIDGYAVRSCVTPLSAVGKKKIVTLEGLGGSAGKLVAIQQAFITEQAAQCGFCINGMIMEAAAFLARNKNPSEAQIKQALLTTYAVAVRTFASCALSSALPREPECRDHAIWQTNSSRFPGGYQYLGRQLLAADVPYDSRWPKHNLDEDCGS